MYGQCFLWITAKSAKLQAVHEAHGLGLDCLQVPCAMRKISKLSSQQVITNELMYTNVVDPNHKPATLEDSGRLIPL